MRTYVIRSRDTLVGIARRFGLALAAVREANSQITNIDLIYAGQVLNIPDVEPERHPKEDHIDTRTDSATVPSFTPLSVQQLCEIVPTLGHDKAVTLIEPLNDAMRGAEINTEVREAAFLAQIAHETGGFRWFRELGAEAYFTRYDGRADLGNTQPGDGLRCRGRGFMQITGRANCERAERALGLDLIANPQLAETPPVAARIAAWFWPTRGLNAFADKGDFITITRRINGGLNGLADREAYYQRAKQVLGVA